MPAVAILSGDDSGQAAAALKAAPHNYHPYDKDFEDLLEALALFSQTTGPPYTDHKQLCDAIREPPLSSETGNAQ